ncbi:hypothetical protein C3F00_025335 [Pseudomonas sp. MWU13-2860]|nr:hypothetical protein C3F00_025335 [Pseudomonas sp. MWU13-2860]
MRIYLGGWLGIGISTVRLFCDQSLLTGAGPVIVTMASPALRTSQRRSAGPVPPLTPLSDSDAADLRFLPGATTRLDRQIVPTPAAAARHAAAARVITLFETRDC